MIKALWLVEDVFSTSECILLIRLMSSEALYECASKEC